jgi:predicted ATPase
MRSRAALTLAQEIAHPATTAVVWLWDTRLHQFLHEVRTVQQRAEAGIALCNEQEVSAYLAGAINWRGWALAMQGQAEDGIQQIQQGLAAARAAGTERDRPYHLALLAEAYGRIGQIEEGLTALAEALAAVDRTGEQWNEAELYRLKGELTLQKLQVSGFKSHVQANQKAKGKGRKKLSVASSQLPVTNPQPLTPNTQAEVEREAEACFQKAIEIARKQQAKSLELRAVMSLVRLRQQQVAQPVSRTTHHETRIRLDAARNTLSEIYNWFTEGFDTKDLQEAKALLEQLQGLNH